MTIAELHGKLAEGRAGGYEYMEDLLTSDVFGTMRYAGWECGFLDWLLRAKAAPVDPFPPPIETMLRPSALLEIEVCFWPRLVNGREPDLALLLRYDSGPALLVLVEAKYLSGMSDYESDASEGEDVPTGDQVLDQVQGMEKMSPHELLEWFEEDAAPPDEPTELRKMHLLVTAHPSLPAGVYKRSVGQAAPSLASVLLAVLGQPSRLSRTLLGADPGWYEGPGRGPLPPAQQEGAGPVQGLSPGCVAARSDCPLLLARTMVEPGAAARHPRQTFILARALVGRSALALSNYNAHVLGG